MSNFGSKFSGSKFSGSKLKYRLGAGLLLLGAVWLAQAAITITRADGWICTSGTIDAQSGTVTPDNASCSDPGGGSSFNLTVTKPGNGSGTVTGNGFSCGADCTESYPGGTAINVTLTASPATGSTFTGWSGAGCTGTGTCTVATTITSSLTVTATFNTSGGGGGGSDPGTGLWINGSNYVHDRGGLSELYVPRCVPDQYSNCRAGGRLSPYDTVVWNQVWAMRIPAGSTFGSVRYPFSIQRAESGETLNGFDFAISTTPGDFSGTNAACKATGDANLYVYGVGFYTPKPFYPACPLTPGSLYYLNVRPAAGSAGATQCGTSAANACRYRIVLPTGFPYSR